MIGPALVCDKDSVPSRSWLNVISAEQVRFRASPSISYSGIESASMATLDILPSNTVIDGSYELPSISFPKPVSESLIPDDPQTIVSKWTSAFTNLVTANKTDVSAVFLKESYWRDLLCLSWNFHTLHGSNQIGSFVSKHPKRWRIKSIEPDTSSDLRRPQVSAIDFGGAHKCIQSFVTLETDVGKAWGIVRLLPDESNNWKCYTFFTVLRELTGHEERIYARRPRGVLEGSKPGRTNWKDDRIREESLEDGEPPVLILGLY